MRKKLIIELIFLLITILVTFTPIIMNLGKTQPGYVLGINHILTGILVFGIYTWIGINIGIEMQKSKK